MTRTVIIFDGSERSYRQWRAVGQGRFGLDQGTIVTEPGADLGLLYLAGRRLEDFTVALDVRADSEDVDSGVHLRFRDPTLPVPDRDRPEVAYRYDNQAYVAAHTGFEVQIGDREEIATGGIVGVPAGPLDGQQQLRRGPPLRAGEWHRLEVEVSGNTFLARLDGVQTARFVNTDPYRGKPPSVDPNSGFLGLQVRRGRVLFRSIELRLPEAARTSDQLRQAGEEAARRVARAGHAAAERAREAAGRWLQGWKERGKEKD